MGRLWDGYGTEGTERTVKGTDRTVNIFFKYFYGTVILLWEGQDGRGTGGTVAVI